MSIVVTFVDYRPLPRLDHVAWTSVRIEESVTPDGPWTTIDTQTLTPVDADPAYPASRSFTTSHGTMLYAWYRIIFRDNVGNEQLPAAPTQNVPDPTEAFQPSIDDVAALMRTRTKDCNGNEIGTFNQDTRPTGAQVQQLIEQATNEVTTCTDTDVPETAFNFMTNAITIKTGMLIELAYYPEQVGTGRSPYEQYAALYDRDMICLTAAVQSEVGDDGLTPGSARWSYPNWCGFVGLCTRW